MSVTLQCGQRSLSLDTPQIMGVLNVTPDSFSDGGQLLSRTGILNDQLLERAVQMVEDGASILDIGGESTRPGAAPVSTQEELDRVMGAVELIAPRLDVISHAYKHYHVVLFPQCSSSSGSLRVFIHISQRCSRIFERRRYGRCRGFPITCFVDAHVR